MSVQEIANKLADYCRKAEWEKAQTELYSDDIVSIEPYETPEFEKETRGMQAVIEKGKKFAGMTEAMHSIAVSEPVVAGNAFAFRLEMDMTMRGERMKSSELCVYETKDGKVVSEQFFM